MAKFSSLNVNSETILIIIVIVIAIIVVVYFLNKKQECFTWIGNCPSAVANSNSNSVPATCNIFDTCGANNGNWECEESNTGGTQWNKLEDDPDPDPNNDIPQ